MFTDFHFLKGSIIADLIQRFVFGAVFFEKALEMAENRGADMSLLAPADPIGK